MKYVTTDWEESWQLRSSPGGHCCFWGEKLVNLSPWQPSKLGSLLWAYRLSAAGLCPHRERGCFWGSAGDEAALKGTTVCWLLGGNCCRDTWNIFVRAEREMACFSSNTRNIADLWVPLIGWVHQALNSRRNNSGTFVAIYLAGVIRTFTMTAQPIQSFKREHF